MASSKASTVAQYLAELPADRRAELAKVRAVVRKHLPAGFQEAMNWGMIAWELPLTRYPDTYNGQPLMYAALGAQKNYLALYLTGVYGNPVLSAMLEEGFRKAGKKPDMGKSCIRFQKAADLPLPVIGKIVARTTVAKFIAAHEAARKR
jgi:uncharacterized protein YdhG (YjbR/CyaY superfamily)